MQANVNSLIIDKSDLKSFFFFSLIVTFYISGLLPFTELFFFCTACIAVIASKKNFSNARPLFLFLIFYTLLQGVFFSIFAGVISEQGYFKFLGAIIFCYLLGKNSISEELFYISFVVGGMVAFLTQLLGTDIGGDFTRLLGGKAEPNVFSIMQIISLLCAIKLFSNTQKPIYLIICACFVLSVFFTGSRSGVVGLALVALFSVPVLSRNLIKTTFGVVIVFLFSNYLSVDLFQFLLNYYEYLINRVVNPSNSDLLSLEERFREIETVRLVFEQNVFSLLFGIGPSNTDYELWSGSLFQRVHSTPFALLIEHGIFGTILFMLLIFGRNMKINLLIIIVLLSSVGNYTLYSFSIILFLMQRNFVQYEK